MSAKRSRALRAAFEGLERRETPSSHAVAALQTAQVVSLQGSGTAVNIISTPGVNGQAVTDWIFGKTKGLGNYSGQLSLFYGLDHIHGTGRGVITKANGDQLALSLSATAHTPGVPRGPGVIHFTVTSGTGALAAAAGSGTLTGHVSLLNGFHYVSHGKVRA